MITRDGSIIPAITVLMLGLIAGILSVEPKISLVVIAILVGLTLIISFIAVPSIVPIILVIVSPFETVYVQISGSHIKIYEIIAILGFVVLLLHYSFKRIKFSPLVLWWMIPLVISDLLSSMHSLDRTSSFQMTLLLCIDVITAFVISQYCSDKTTFRRVYATLVWVVTIISFYGIVQVIANKLGFQVPLSQQNIFTVGRAYSTFSEGDWFGTYCMMGIFILLPELNKRKSAVLNLIVILMGLVLSFARTSWVILALGIVIVMFAKEYRRTAVRVGNRIFIVMIGFLSVAVLVFPSLVTQTLNRLSNSANVGSNTFQVRLGAMNGLWKYGFQHPWLGHGPGESGMVNIYGQLVQGPLLYRVSTNATLDFWFNNGLIGVICLLFFIFGPIILRKKIKLVYFTEHSFYLIIAVFLLFLTFQLSNAFFFGFYWIDVGLMFSTIIFNRHKTLPEGL